MGASAACMNNPFRRALMIEMRDLFAQDEILKQSRAAHSCSQRILIIRNRKALIGGQWNFTGRRLLVCFTAFNFDHRDCGSRRFRSMRSFAWHKLLILSRSTVVQFGVET